MPDLKISEFVDGDLAQTGDEIATNRSGVNTKVRVGTAAALEAGSDIGEVLLIEDISGQAGLPALDGSRLTGLNPNDAVANAVADQYIFSSDTTMAEPGAGFVRFNETDIADVTAIAISNITNTEGSPDIGDYIFSWSASSSVVKGTIRIRQIGGAIARFNLLSLTDNSTWHELDVAYIDSDGTIVDDDNLLIAFTAKGDKGDQGIQGIQGEEGPEGPQGPAGSGTLETVVAGGGISVDDTDPNNPVVSLANMNAGTVKVRAATTAGAASDLPAFLVQALGNVTGSVTLNLANGRALTATVTGSTTFTISNPMATGLEDYFTLRLVNGGASSVSWPASVDWAAGNAPALTASGVDNLVFQTLDGGTNWTGAALLDVK